MSRRATVGFVALAVALFATGLGAAVSMGRTADTAAGARLVQVGNFSEPVYVTGAPGYPSALFVVQLTGQIMLMRGGHVQARPFLNIKKLITNAGREQGLLGLAFSPGYATNGLFYVDYTMPDNDIRIEQYQRSSTNPNIANPSSARVVLTIAHHQNNNHNGGELQFGPDGDLYISVGDGGNEDDPDNNGQNTGTLLGKILRISPSPRGGYTIPPSNPFVGQSGKRAEIWAYGLRNPWRFSFDLKTGDMVIGDVGQDLFEEIDFAPAGTGAGANYGWSVWEGDRRNKPGTAKHAVFPVLVLPHSKGYCAVIGGYVMRDPTVPSLYGRYLFGDNCRSEIEAVTLTPGHAKHLVATGLEVGGTTGFGEDDAGHVYIASYNGPVYRIES